MEQFYPHTIKIYTKNELHSCGRTTYTTRASSPELVQRERLYNSMLQDFRTVCSMCSSVTKNHCWVHFLMDKQNQSSDQRCEPRDQSFVTSITPSVSCRIHHSPAATPALPCHTGAGKDSSGLSTQEEIPETM